jgi:surface polysaccharide O-acyltransferase-like enzyme
MNAEDSAKINLLRFPLIVGVIMVHAHRLVGLPDGPVQATAQYPAALYTELLVAHLWSQITAPLFFMFAGYLLYRQVPLTRSLWLSKVKNRLTTLGVPYLCWNGAIFLLFFVAQSIPRFQAYFTRPEFEIRAMNWWQRADLLLGITRFPIDYQLWFLRDLIVLAAISPLIWLAMKYARLATLGFFFVLWTGVWGDVSFSQSMALLFFSIGIALGQVSGERLLIPKHMAFMVVFVVLGLIEVVYQRDLSSDSFSDAINVLHRVTTLIGICAGWRFASWMWKSASVSAALGFLAEYSFFLFAAHEPMLTVFRKLGFRLLGHDSSAKLLTVYFGSVLLTIVVCVGSAIILQHLLPWAYRTLTGGRRPAVVRTPALS